MSDDFGLSSPQSSSASLNERQHLQDRLKRTATAAALFVFALVAYFVSRFIPAIPDPIQEFFLALTAAMSVHLLDRLWLYRDTAESFDKLQRRIVQNVDDHTKRKLDEIHTALQKSVRSLEAMSKTGLVRLYGSREEASDDIASDFDYENNHKIRLAGISLNDFILRKDPRFGLIWHKLQLLLKNGIAENRTLDIRILLIDPSCFGAQLRAKGEERDTGKSQAGRLEHDVEIAIGELLYLEETFKTNGLRFECKLYRLPPIMFLFWTDTVCYTQQYYFWSSRLDVKSFPVCKFHSVHTIGAPKSIHAELDLHFNWIWDQASIGLKDYRMKWLHGADKGIAQTGNFFTDPSEGLKRIENILKDAGETITIQGITLHSFFSRTNPRLYQLLSELVMNDKVNMTLLFLNPDCEQAKFRAFREYSLENPEMTFVQYLEDNDITHRKTDLYKDTIAAKHSLELMICEIAVKKGPEWKPKLQAGFYNSAPYSFVLRADNSVLVEQYHYGKLPDDQYGPRIILGKDLPLVEYIRIPSSIFGEPQKLPFDLLVSSS